MDNKTTTEVTTVLTVTNPTVKNTRTQVSRLMYRTHRTTNSPTHISDLSDVNVQRLITLRIEVIHRYSSFNYRDN